MRKIGFLLFVLLSLAAISILFLGASMMAQTDADFLLFSHQNALTDENNLYIYNPSTGEERLITALMGYADAGWSPDGRIWVVDNLNDEERRLRFFNPETGEETLFGENLYVNQCFANLYWSPDGNQWAYLSQTEDDKFLNVLDSSDGSSYQILIGEYEKPYWSPDSQYLFVNTGYGAAPSELFLAEDGRSISSPMSLVAFSPDSRYISYVRAGKSYLYEIATGGIVEIEDAYYGRWSNAGRYFISSLSRINDSLSYYDSEIKAFETIELGFPIAFAAWAEDDTAILLYADFSDIGEELPRSLLRYELESQNITILLDDTGWVDAIQRNGAWFAIRYSTLPSEYPSSPTNRLLFTDGTNRVDAEITVATGWYRPNIQLFGADFVIQAHQGLYYFDSSSQSLESIYSKPLTSLYLSSNYLAFIGTSAEGQLSELTVWDKEQNRFSVVPQRTGQILGWRGSSERGSLLYCGEG